MNQFDVLLTGIVNVRKGQTDMPYQGEHKSLTKKGMRHQVCHGEAFCINI